MRIDIYHDTACPWCRIGRAHLQEALARWTGEPVEVVYHAFFLNPGIPPEGYPFRAYMHAKGGGQVPLEGWFDAPHRMGAQAGLTFHFERITKAPNTTLSHLLIALTPAAQQAAIIDALYAAYFEHGQDIGDVDVLAQIAAAQGLAAADIRARLHAGEGRDAVIADARQGQAIGVSGVPFFIVGGAGGRYAFSGAQPPHVILDVMRQATAQADPAHHANVTLEE